MILFFIVAMFFLTWRLLIPVEIIDVHRSDSRYTIDIIVKNFPLTDKGKIDWWEKNKKTLEDKYNIPNEKSDYSIGIWVGDYKAEPNTDQGSDLLCFEDMSTPKNCIEKGNQPLQIWHKVKKGETIFLFDNWKRTYVKKNTAQ